MEGSIQPGHAAGALAAALIFAVPVAACSDKSSEAGDAGAEAGAGFDARPDSVPGESLDAAGSPGEADVITDGDFPEGAATAVDSGSDSTPVDAGGSACKVGQYAGALGGLYSSHLTIVGANIPVTGTVDLTLAPAGSAGTTCTAVASEPRSTLRAGRPQALQGPLQDGCRSGHVLARHVEVGHGA